MYVITASWDSPDETPIHAFDAKNDVEALTKAQDDLDEYIQKCRTYFFGAQPWSVAVWNVTAEPVCVHRYDTYIEPKN